MNKIVIGFITLVIMMIISSVLFGGYHSSLSLILGAIAGYLFYKFVNDTEEL